MYKTIQNNELINCYHTVVYVVSVGVCVCVLYGCDLLAFSVGSDDI